MMNAGPLQATSAQLMQVEAKTDQLIKLAWQRNCVTRLMHEPLGHHLNATWCWMAVLTSKPPGNGTEYTGWGATTADALLHALLTAEDGEIRRKQEHETAVSELKAEWNRMAEQDIGSFKTGVVDASSLDRWERAKTDWIDPRQSHIPDWMGGVVPGGTGSFHDPAATPNARETRRADLNQRIMAACDALPEARFPPFASYAPTATADGFSQTVGAPPAVGAGATRPLVAGMTVVTADGEIIDLQRLPRAAYLTFATEVGGAHEWTLHRKHQRQPVTLFANFVRVAP